jgi:tyrosine-protein kinase Etk/Wzc
MENKTDNTQGQQSNFSENALNFKVILGKFMAFLPFFILSAIISISIAYLVNRYATPRFSLKATLLIKDKGRGSFDGAESFLQGSSLLMQSKNIENEIGILKSRSLVEKTLSNIDFRISYFTEGNVKKSEIYKNPPFFIEIDSNHFQTYGVPIFINFLSNNQVELTTNGKSGKVLIPYNEQDVNGVNGKIDKKIFNLTNNIESENFKFKITLFDKNLINFKDNKYYFIVNSKSSLINKYSNNYAIKTINKQSSIIEISKESEYPEKDIDFINTLCQTYIDQGFDDKAQISTNTINFINLQLNDLQDTLRNIENNLLAFKTNNKILSVGEEGKVVMAKLYKL